MRNNMKEKVDTVAGMYLVHFNILGYTPLKQTRIYPQTEPILNFKTKLTQVVREVESYEIELLDIVNEDGQEMGQSDLYYE